MEKPATETGGGWRANGPAWASCLGVVAVVLGVVLTASHGNQWMTQGVITPISEQGEPMPEPACPEDELEEEGITLAECEQLATGVQDLLLSRPDWFRSYQMTVSGIGTGLAFLSILVGAALVNYRPWAPAAAIAVFGALLAVDVFQFIGVVNTGPIMRSMYLWDILLWFVIHLMMVVGAAVGRESGQTA